MKKAFLKSSMAVALSAATVLANALPVLATAPITSGEGTGAGTSTGHLDTSYIEASFPTNKTIADFFNFYVDAENIIGNNEGVKFTADGEAVTANDSLVYFATESGFDSTSEDIEITIKNYQDVDVTATATVSGIEGFTLVEDATTIDNTEAASEASLYLGLKVGTENYVAITEDGATSTCKFDGQSDNFEVTGTAGSYSADPKDDAEWGKIVLNMTGKAQLVSDATDITAPTIAFTWAVTLHSDAPTADKTTVSGTNNVVVFSQIGTATGISAVKLTPAGGSQVTLATTGKYTVTKTDDTITLTFVSTVLAGNKGAAIVVEFDNGQTVNLAVAN